MIACNGKCSRIEKFAYFIIHVPFIWSSNFICKRTLLHCYMNDWQIYVLLLYDKATVKALQSTAVVKYTENAPLAVKDQWIVFINLVSGLLGSEGAMHWIQISLSSKWYACEGGLFHAYHSLSGTIYYLSSSTYSLEQKEIKQLTRKMWHDEK